MLSQTHHTIVDTYFSIQKFAYRDMNIDIDENIDVDIDIDTNIDIDVDIQV